MTTYSPCCRHVTFSSTSRTLLARASIHHPAKMHHNGYAERETTFGDWRLAGPGSSHKSLAKRDGLSSSAGCRTASLPSSAYCRSMARIILFLIAAVVALV